MVKQLNSSSYVYRFILLFLFAYIFHGSVTASSFATTDTAPNQAGRKLLIGSLQSTMWVGTFVGLNSAWYNNYPRQPFHLFNDWGEWQQMDKLGHMWTTYQISRASSASWEWAGVDSKKAVWLGAASGIAFQSVIEVLDGFSQKWGFSMYDMAANVAGAGLFVLQGNREKKPLVGIKMSYVPIHYSAEWEQRATELFGATGIGRVLKDYNGQTYWITVNLQQLSGQKKIPSWFNLAIGHGAQIMLGGRENVWRDPVSGQVNDARSFQRQRRLFLSIDVDLTRIPTHRKWLKTAFSLLNCLKIPAPAIEYNPRGSLTLHPFYF